MRLKQVEVCNFRAVGQITLPLDSRLTVLHGDNANGKTSILTAIAVGLGAYIKELSSKFLSLDFDETDLRDSENPARTTVTLTMTDDLSWQRIAHPPKGKDRSEVTKLREFVATLGKRDLPIVAFYGTNRTVFDLPQNPNGFKTDFVRMEALDGALTARASFKAMIEWFHAKENEELRGQREHRDFNFHLPDLDAVRRAIVSMIPDATEPHIDLNPLRFVVSLRRPDGQNDPLSINELSGGYRTMLALVSDLARRMAQGNPHMDDPLQAEAIVLIDEVDLHLHPSWQQRVLGDLMRTFPKTQFIVTTHSPQVLSTVKPQNIIRLRRDQGQDTIVAEEASSATFGAESGQILETEMGVAERPRNAFTEALDAYMSLVDKGLYSTPEALALREKLEEMSPADTALDQADSEIRRRKVLESLGRKAS